MTDFSMDALFRDYHEEDQYLMVLEDLLREGDFREGRNGGVYSLFGRQMRFDLSKGFPLLTTKKVHLKSIIVELLWFLRGDTNIKFLHDHGVTIWDEWADENGDLGPVYGKQWRSWPSAPAEEHRPSGVYLVPGESIDQIKDAVERLKADPYSRRHMVTAWNPAEVQDMALPPCHCLFQFHVSKGRLNCQLYQRSADVFLGVPFNIASYALLTMMMAKATGLEPGEFVYTLGDYHLYGDHIEAAKTQLGRMPNDFPSMTIANKTDIFGFTLGDFTLTGYDPHPAIKAKVSK